ncbi:MAG: lipopolysaccharide biosynthesis protein, partial [Rubricoccaceae bacterium]|nr:lipopolysaccharide biosynthesis protein [Rubricoccaceae bacterium]
LVLLVTVVAAVVFVVISLVLPVKYQAETRVMLPESGGAGSVLGMLESVAPGASALLGSESGGYTRYLSIVTSRTAMDDVVERFDLETSYETTDHDDPRGDAIKELRNHFEFEVALDFDYLAIRVLDRNPEKAARMANYFVEVLNREHMRLTSASARQNRESVGRRLEEAHAALDSAQVELQEFQELHGVLDVQEQGAAFFQSLATMRATIAQLEIQYGSLRRQFGDENPQTAAARDALREARASLSRYTSGADDLMPVPMRDLPEVSRRYAEIYQEVVTQTSILEVIQPLYEQARFSEEREAQAVQVLDPAIPPVRKARPQRKIIVIAGVLSVVMITCMYVLALAWWRRNRTAIRKHLSAT